MKYKTVQVFKVFSAYNPAGALVVAESLADAVKTWCESTDSLETAIAQVDVLGSAYVGCAEVKP